MGLSWRHLLGAYYDCDDDDFGEGGGKENDGEEDIDYDNGDFNDCICDGFDEYLMMISMMIFIMTMMVSMMISIMILTMSAFMKTGKLLLVLSFNSYRILPLSMLHPF